MLLGREFQLATATIAIDAHFVTVRLPGDSFVKVISEESDGKMIHVLSGGLQYRMFAVDLTQRGLEVNKEVSPKPQPDIRPSDQISPTSDPDHIRQRLQRELEVAQQHRMEASEHFSDVMSHLPSGIPHPDGTARIQLASRQYSIALKGAMDAMTRLNEFLLQGTIPSELERKPAASEIKDDQSRKAGKV